MTELVRRIALEKQEEIDKLKDDLEKERRKNKTSSQVSKETARR